jgi:hypothetical protein
MKTILILAAAIVTVGAAGSRESVAGGPLPWCEYGAMTGNGPGNCSYYTFAQCMQMARGDGTCERNPRFDALYYQRGQVPPVDIAPNGRPLRPIRPYPPYPYK